MKIEVNIKEVDCRYGTSKWLMKQIESGNIWFEESNDHNIPMWAYGCISDDVQTHGLTICNNKHSSLIAYRDTDGKYKYDINSFLGYELYSNCCSNFTKSAKNILQDICMKWIMKVESKDEEQIHTIYII